MRLFINEFKKILHMRVIIFAFVALFALNGGLVFWQSQKTAELYILSQDEYVNFYDYCINNPKEIDDYYAELIKYNTSQEAVRRRIEMSGGEFIETRQAIYTDGLYTNDLIIIEAFYSDYNWANSYVKETEIFIKNTETNYNEYLYQGYSPDSYLCKFQLRVKELYTNSRDNVKLIFEPVHGWQNYYSFKITGILLLGITTLVASVVFIREKDVGILPIIKVSKKGRIHTSISKMWAVCLFVSACSVLLTLETYILFGLTEGYSAGSNAIQILPELRRSWLVLSLSEYFWVHLILRTLSAIVFAMSIMAVSVFLYNYILTYMAALALFGLNFLMYSSESLFKSSIFRYINLISLAEGVRPVERYYGINLFSLVCGYLTFILGFTVAFISFAMAVTIFLYCRSISGIDLKWASACINKIHIKLVKRKKTTKLPKLHSLSTRLTLMEGYKLIFATRFSVIILILLVLKIYMFYQSSIVTDAHIYKDALYETYVNIVEGEWSEEKNKLLNTLMTEQINIIDTYEEMLQKNKDELITADEYLDYLKLYRHAHSRLQTLTELVNHSNYLKQSAEKSVGHGHFLYETGWRLLFDLGPDFFLYVSLLILLTGIFSQEYGRDYFSKILRCTKRGRAPTFYSKLLNTVIIATGLSILYQSISFIGIYLIYRLPCPDAPLYSLESYSTVTSGITILQFFWLLILLRVVAAIVLALTIFCFSELLRRYISIMALTAAVTLLPAVMMSLGLELAKKIDYLSFFQGKPLFMASSNAAWFSSDVGVMFTYLALICVVQIILIYTVKRHYTRQ